MVGMLGILLALLLGFGSSDGVTVHLKNGKSVHGQLLQETPKFVLLEIDLGQLLVQRKNIKSVVQDNEDQGPEEGAGKAGGDQSPHAPTKPQRLQGSKAEPAAPSGIAVSEEAPYRSQFKAKKPKPEESETKDPLRQWTLPLQTGCLLDRYTWFYDLKPVTKVSVGFGLLFLLWVGFLLGGRILGVDSITGKRALAATSLWFVLLVGVLLIPNPSLIIIGVLLFLLLVAWFISSRGVLGLGWFHSFVLLVLGGFGLSLVALVVEVSESLINL